MDLDYSLLLSSSYPIKPMCDPSIRKSTTARWPHFVIQRGELDSPEARDYPSRALG